MPVALGIASLALTAKGMSDQKTAASRAQQAAKDAQVNPAAVAAQAKEQAFANARDSAALEKELNPLAPELRTKSLQAVIDSLKGGQYDDADLNALYDQINEAPQTGQFEDYAQSQLSEQAQQEALRQLALGGKLDQETANQVMRAGAAKAGRFGNGLGLGRDISARDLGLTSLDLARERLNRAQSFGSAQDAFTANRAGMKNNFNLSNLQMLIQQIRDRNSGGFGLVGLKDARVNADMARRFSAAGLGQSIEQPVTGLDPGAVANLAVGNANAAGAAGANGAALKASAGQGWGQLGGQLFGLGASMYNNGGTYNAGTLPTTVVDTGAYGSQNSTPWMKV